MQCFHLRFVLTIPLCFQHCRLLLCRKQAFLLFINGVRLWPLSSFDTVLIILIYCRALREALCILRLWGLVFGAGYWPQFSIIEVLLCLRVLAESLAWGAPHGTFLPVELLPHNHAFLFHEIVEFSNVDWMSELVWGVRFDPQKLLTLLPLEKVSPVGQRVIYCAQKLTGCHLSICECLWASLIRTLQVVLVSLHEWQTVADALLACSLYQLIPWQAHDVFVRQSGYRFRFFLKLAGIVSSFDLIWWRPEVLIATLVVTVAGIKNGDISGLATRLLALIVSCLNVEDLLPTIELGPSLVKLCCFLILFLDLRPVTLESGPNSLDNILILKAFYPLWIIDLLHLDIDKMLPFNLLNSISLWKLWWTGYFSRVNFNLHLASSTLLEHRLAFTGELSALGALTVLIYYPIRLHGHLKQ